MITRVCFLVLYVVMLVLLCVAAVAVWDRVWWLGLIFGGCALSGFSGVVEAASPALRKTFGLRSGDGGSDHRRVE